MDFLPIFSTLFEQLWYFIPLFILIAIFKSAWFKGALGEFAINRGLKILLPAEQYHLFKNVTLPTEDGTTQIDHIVVSQFGIFAIETKNMKGWIFGSEKQATWTQKIYKKSYKFQNPLRQNYKHTQTLAATLGVDHSAIFSVIVFIGDSSFKTQMPENVTYGRGCPDFIKSKSAELLTEEEVSQVISAIENDRLKPGVKTHIKHVKHVKQIVQEKESQVTCPRCGAPMVERKAKKGPNAGNIFWGCSGFPKCRAAKAVE